MDYTALLQKIKTHWEQQLPFVVYASPQQIKAHVLLQQDSSSHSAKNFSNTGFVFVPFDNTNTWFCIPEAFSEKITLEVSMPSVLNTDSPFCQELVSDKEKHLVYVSEILENIKNKTVEKVVATRKKEISLTSFDLSELIKCIISQDTSAFRYVWYHPKTGIWCGASPEVLLESNGVSFSTMALAGTQKVSLDKNPTWGQKETFEQQ